MNKPATSLLRAAALTSLSLTLCLVAGCEDNVGRAFDPDFNGGGGAPGTSQVKLPVVDAIVKNVRPRATHFAPKGPGVANTTPVTVLFSEAMNPDSIFNATANPPVSPSLFITKKIDTASRPTTQPVVPVPVAATYDFLASNRLVVIRPAVLEDESTYQIMLTTAARDIDGIGVERNVTLGEFSTNPAETETKLVVLSVFPPLASEAELRETQVYAIFNKPVDQPSVTSSSFHVRQESSGAVLPGAVSFPLRQLNQQPDARIARIDPASALPGDADIGIVLTVAITAGTDKLAPGKIPFATFRTIPFLTADAIAVGNATPGFPNRVNLNNVGSLLVDVRVPATALAGDLVTARIYGGDPLTKATGDLRFVEKSQTLTAPGPGTVMVDFGNALGIPGATVLEDGTLSLFARLERGGQVSGYKPGLAAAAVQQDTVRPTLTRVGPPSGTDPLTVFVTDLNSASLHGQASEPIGALTLVVDATTVELFASAENRFVSRPFELGRRTAPVSFSLLLTDRAGNMAAGANAGEIRQRAATTGSVAGGSLLVEAYDEATLAPVAGAAVLVEPGMPQKPPAGRIQTVTDAAGRAEFSGLTAPDHTVTIVAPGFQLVTRLATSAAFVSLPLRRMASATATLGGSVTYSTLLGSHARVGANVFDSRPLDGQVKIPTAGATAIPATPIRPGRPIVLSAFSGPPNPTTIPTYGSYACALCPTGGLQNATGPLVPPLAAAAAGSTVETSLVLSPAPGTMTNYLSPYAVSLATATGLDIANLTGPPEVIVQATLGGLGGTVPLGIGFASGSAGAGYNVNGTYSGLSVLQLVSLAPVLWSSMQVTDTSGNVGRARALFVNSTSGFVVGLGPFPGIPTVATPAGGFTGAPLVSFADRLDPTAVGNSPAFSKVTARDPAGRLWVLWLADLDAAAGNKTVQVPDLTGTGLIGLDTGVWKVAVENWQTFSFSELPENFVLEEIDRQHMTYALSRAVDHTVN